MKILSMRFRMCTWIAVVVILMSVFDLSVGWTPSILRATQDCRDVESTASTTNGLKNRRTVLSTLVTAPVAALAVLSSSQPAVAADKPQEFVNVGTQAPAPDGEAPFVALPSGVKIKDFKVGTGDAVVTPTSSRVSIQGKGRLLNLNGVIFYNTKDNDPDGFGPLPLTIDLGKGQVIPGLEEGLVGMKKGGIRRIIIPQNLAYNNNPGLEPKPINANDQRALDSVVKNSRRDGSVLFDVQVERFK